MEFYEIHRYDNGIFQYVVTRTNKYPKHKVREDADRMNKMLTAALKSQGTWYEFVVASNSDQTRDHPSK